MYRMPRTAPDSLTLSSSITEETVFAQLCTATLMDTHSTLLDQETKKGSKLSD